MGRDNRQLTILGLHIIKATLKEAIFIRKTFNRINFIHILSFLFSEPYLLSPSIIEQISANRPYIQYEIERKNNQNIQSRNNKKSKISHSNNL